MDVLETLNNTKPAERAKVGAELLGRGWQAVAPILGKTRAEYEAMLAEVEEGQVITKSEAAKAEKWRLAMDKLGDAIKDISLAVGEQVAELAPYIVKLAEVVALLAELKPSADIPKIGDHLRDMAAAAEDSGDAIAYLVEKGYSVKAAEMLMADYRAEVEAAEAPMDKLKSAAEAAEEAQRGLAAGAKAARDMIEDQRESIEDAVESMYDLEEATMAGDQAYDNYTAAAAAAEAELASGNLTAAEQAEILRDLRGAQIDVAEGALKQAQEFAKAQGASDGTKASYMLQITALEGMQKKYPLLAAEIQRYIDKLNQIPGVKNTNVTVSYGGNKGGDHAGVGGVVWKAHGGRYSGGQTVGMDEAGPEVEFKDSGGYVMNSGDTKKLIDGLGELGSGSVSGPAATGGNMYITIHAPNVDANQVVRIIKEQQRRGAL
jgi:hypothetical protein